MLPYMAKGTLKTKLRIFSWEYYSVLSWLVQVNHKALYERDRKSESGKKI